MRWLEKVERKQGDWVKFGLLVKLMQEVTVLQFKVVFYFFVSSLFAFIYFDLFSIN